MRFSIRDLLLMTMIVALAAGWWVDRSRLTERIFRGARANGHERPEPDKPTPVFEERMRRMRKS